MNAGYNKANGEVKENAETHIASTITAKDTLTTKSGQDTNIIGSKLEGNTVKMEVGKDLNIESLQDKETYDEKNNSSGFNFSVEVSQPKGKPATYENAGITGGKNKGKTNSTYESVTDQAGIYAGKGGFDIEVGKNTDLKGAVIASEADASKNKLSTDTLTYSDIENKAEYSSSSSGFNFDSKGEIPITPSQGMPANGEAESTTKSAIAEGTIEIRSNENQNISDLSRNTQEALNKLEKIFDAKTVKEQQELADLFGEVAFKAVGDIADRNWKNAKTPEEKAKWAEGGEYKILLHTLVGRMMSEFAGNGFKSGAISAGISQALQNQLSKIEDKGLRLIAGGLVAGTVNKVLGLKPEVGSSIAISGIKNNDYCHRPTTEGSYIFVEGQGYFIIENGIDVYMQGDVPPAGAVVWYQDYDNQDYGNEFIKGDGGINLSDTYFQWEERTIIAGAGMAQQYVKIHVAVDDNENDISVNGMPLISPDDYGEYQRALDLYNYYGGTSMDAKAGMILLEGGASLTGNGTKVIDGMRIIEGKVGGKIPLDDFIKIRSQSIHNGEAELMTLGKYTNGTDSYISVAGENSTYFDLGTKWENVRNRYNLTNNEMFEYFNKPALDDAISNGKVIQFSHNPELPAYENSFLAQEWKYLKDKYGYQSLKKEGDVWIAR
ncbi:hemagglutinin repeat-containing protein [Anaerosinus gibii]|uniref:Hemagglutinin repeat-containing protein n=1 Tax=Selenobaculum gibii TaxID=3054208 RepID=A0A9Y2AL65_9FIRM|nr:hemagglutinin repeat-containing protein [Selenobaculum gbiensis]WIW71923.1 hemagglutinin repeat-containing protein [Selenobaculum gbiensis]